jgi:hypothetical protein
MHVRSSVSLLAALVLFVSASCSPTSDYVKTNGGADTPSPKGEVRRVDFESASVGALPLEFINVLGEWTVESSGSGKILKQRGDYHNADFPRIVLKDFSFENVHVKARCSMQDGDDDRACGLMFRFRDSDNYYITRANALEDNVRLYRVIGGDRQELASKSLKVTASDWHTLEAFAEGPRLRVLWDGQEIISFEDGSFAKGKVGLWTKADSITCFDDFEASEL